MVMIHEKEDLTDKELERRIQSINRRRASYYEYYTGQRWGDRIHFLRASKSTRSPSMGRRIKPKPKFF